MPNGNEQTFDELVERHTLGISPEAAEDFFLKFAQVEEEPDPLNIRGALEKLKVVKPGVARAPHIGELIFGEREERPGSEAPPAEQFVRLVENAARDIAGILDFPFEVAGEFKGRTRPENLLARASEMGFFRPGIPQKTVGELARFIPEQGKTLLEAAAGFPEAQEQIGEHPLGPVFAAVIGRGITKLAWTPKQLETALKRGDPISPEVLKEFPETARLHEAVPLPESPPLTVNSAGLVEGVGRQLVRLPGKVINDFTGVRPTDEIARVAQDLVSDFVGKREVGRFESSLRFTRLKKEFGKPVFQGILERFRLREKTPDQLDDMTFYLQKTHNPRVPNDTPGKVTARLSPEAREAVSQYRKLADSWREAANATGYGKDINYIENWIHQMWILPKGRARGIAQGVITKGAFENQRKFMTFVDGMNAQYKPKTTNFADLVQVAEESYSRVIASRELVKAIYDANEQGVKATDSRPVISIGFDKKLPDYTKYDHPALKKGVKDVYFHPDFGQHLEAVFGGVGIWSKKFPRFLSNFNAVLKSSWVRFSLFHNLTLAESAMATFGPFTGILKAGRLSFGIPGISQATRALSPALRIDPAKAKYAIESGVQIGPMTGIGMSQWKQFHLGAAQKLENLGAPGRLAGQVPRTALAVSNVFDEALWTHFHNNIKLQAFYTLFDEMLRLKDQPQSGINKLAGGIRNKVFLRNVRMKSIKEMPVDDIRRQVASFVNDAFGGQRWEELQVKWMKSPSAQKALRLIFLSPDWLTSQLRVFSDIFATGSPVKQSLAVRYWRNAAIMHFGYLNILNYILTSLDPTTEAHFMQDNEPGRRHDLQLPAFEETASGRQARRFMFTGKQFREAFRMLSDPPFGVFKYFSGKAAPLPTAVSLISTGRTPSGFPSALTKEREKFIKGQRGPILAAERAKLVAVDVAKHFTPISIKGNQFFFAAPKRRGINFYAAMDMLANAKAQDDVELIQEVIGAMKDNNFSPRAINQAQVRAGVVDEDGRPLFQQEKEK